VSTIIIAFGLTFVLLMGVNPYQSPVWIIILFYTNLTILIAGILALIGFYYKIQISNREVIFSHIYPTLRQGVLIAIVLVGLLFLKQIDSLNWWAALLLVMSVLLLELFFRSKK
jgi:hypothetical protein